MQSNLSRRGFFRQVGHDLSSLASELGQSLAAPDTALPDPLLADFTPVLLADEARRLGLDPDCEPADLLRAIRQRMQERRQG
jgi:hypothetical protein